MPEYHRTVAPGPLPRSAVADDGRVLTPPEDWSLLPPGDTGLTRRVKAAGPCWTVVEYRGRKPFSRGVWALTLAIDKARADLEVERATPEYARRHETAAARRGREQEAYVDSFEAAILRFLAFHPRHLELARALAAAVTAHATPVGSGTVARTRRIPVEKRAEAAVIAWMRHRTTAYDEMPIPRQKGRRHEIRRELAGRSKDLLGLYRADSEGGGPDCPLRTALAEAAESSPTTDPN